MPCHVAMLPLLEAPVVICRQACVFALFYLLVDLNQSLTGGTSWQRHSTECGLHLGRSPAAKHICSLACVPD